MSDSLQNVTDSEGNKTVGSKTKIMTLYFSSLTSSHRLLLFCHYIITFDCDSIAPYHVVIQKSVTSNTFVKKLIHFCDIRCEAVDKILW